MAKKQLTAQMKNVLKDACKASPYKAHGGIGLIDHRTRNALAKRGLIELCPSAYVGVELWVLSGAGWQYCYDAGYMDGSWHGFNTYAKELEAAFKLRGGESWWKVVEAANIHRSYKPNTFYRPQMLKQGELF